MTKGAALDSAQTAFTHGGFFVLRAPLLPFETLLELSRDLTAASSDPRDGRSSKAGDDLPAPIPGEADGLEKALETDRARVRARLRELALRPEVREALFVASPDLDASLPAWLGDEEGERAARVERAVYRYLARMAGRATPFGLFAACSLGVVGDKTRLEIEPRARCRRHTRLDTDYLDRLARALGETPAVREALRHRPNSSLYRVAGRAHYVESSSRDGVRLHHLVAVDRTDYLDATLERARGGATPADLAEGLVSGSVSPAEASAYVQSLIESQILTSELAPCVTAVDGAASVERLLETFPAGAEPAAFLARARQALESIDREGIGHPPERYRAIARMLEPLPCRVELPRLFQVDLFRDGGTLEIGPEVVGEIARGVEWLHRLAPRASASPVARFREAFERRYEQREVPLAEALDEELGVGFDLARRGPDVAPLLRDLRFPRRPSPEEAPDGDRMALLLRTLDQALRTGSIEAALSESELGEPGSDRSALPDAFSVFATLAADSIEALATGDFTIVLGGAGGPSGARFFGRFCHGDPSLARAVEAHLRSEEALRPGARFAEIVHLPEGRIGNVLARPALRELEIPYLGRSGVVPERQVPLEDLWVSVRGGRVALRSRRLGCEIVPRLTSAHNYSWRALGVYRFLCSLQEEGVAARLGWDWGPLRGAPFLPRVRIGRVVLSRARWRLEGAILESLARARGAERWRRFQEHRHAHRMPRWVALADADNLLPLDLDNVFALDVLAHQTRERKQADLVELEPAPDRLCAQGPEGRFVHELIVPFVRVRAAPVSKGNGLRPPATASGLGRESRDSSGVRETITAARTFAPGSEWLYARFHTGPATADRILCRVLAPLAREAVASGAAERWFFLRFADPDWHLRVRFEGPRARLREEVLPALERAAEASQEEGSLHRLILDTYERELERYGGPDGIRIAESVFHADSEAVVEILDSLLGDGGADARWRLALVGSDRLLADMGFDLEQRRAIIDESRAGLAARLEVDSGLERSLSDLFRSERRSLEDLMGDRAPASLAPGLRALASRSDRLAPWIAELRRLVEQGAIATTLRSLSADFVHLHVNRLLRSGHAQQELALYDVLGRLYASRLARQGSRDEKLMSA
ncbi:MAG: Lanthionine biosynthesis protein LanB [Candidatus Eisenbacteria bacterium]|uniref:Lanthionine biosynthesis protein LanB n=1 Tax=Eiseniibacteriota bacterium TaxID=2212470 RepID=A0A538TI00_UNCEI|nr:MAG: Lanthionine biosynthesis protein LanB [Candidatus Eisenbacteria bacterium]